MVTWQRLSDKLKGGLILFGLLEDAESSYVRNDSNSRRIIAKLDKVLVDKSLYLKSNLTIHDLAREVGTNRTYISNSIRDEKGLNFSEYINKFRVQYALEIIEKKTISKESRISLLDIAIMSGFGSVRVLNRHFTNYIGITPFKYKRILLSELITPLQSKDLNVD